MPFGEFGSDDNTMDLLGLEVQKSMYKDMDFSEEISKESNREYMQSRTKNRRSVKKIIFTVIVVILCVAAFFTYKFFTRNYYCQEYVAGAKGIKGNVDIEKFTQISEDFAIGANVDGFAVFKNPSKAFRTFKEMYADEINSVREEFGLGELTKSDYLEYLAYSRQSRIGTDEERSRKSFISSFLDIYNNSSWKY